MYNREEHWEAMQLDWKQLGTMIIAIVSEIEPSGYHSIKLSQMRELENNKFVTTLFEEGTLTIKFVEINMSETR